MTETSRPWQSTTPGDAGPYSASDWQQLYQHIIGLGGLRANVGVFLGSGTPPNEGLRVQAQNPATASIDVLSGAALVQGLAYINTATEDFAIAANASGNPRIDTVVLEADYALQTCRLAVEQGTAAASPVPPTLTQNAGILWQIPLADIAVANGFTTLAQSTIRPRHEWVNAPPGVYLDNVLNNSGAVLEDGAVVVWDNTADRAVTTTTTLDNKSTAGVVRGRVAIGGYARVQTKGIGYVYNDAAVAIGNKLVTGTTAGQSTDVTSVDNKVIGRALETTTGAGLVLAAIDVHMVRDMEFLLYQDVKNSGTAPASIVQAAWRVREITTEVIDTGGFGSLPGSNIIQLQPGTYEVWAGAPIATAVAHGCRWFNNTSGAMVIEGPHTLSGIAVLYGEFTITVVSDFRLEHWTNTTSNGGVALSTGASERYATVYLRRHGENI